MVSARMRLFSGDRAASNCMSGALMKSARLCALR